MNNLVAPNKNCISIDIRYADVNQVIRATTEYLDFCGIPVMSSGDNELISVIRSVLPDYQFTWYDSQGLNNLYYDKGLDHRLEGYWEISSTFNKLSFIEDWFEALAPYLTGSSTITIYVNSIEERGFVGMFDDKIFWTDNKQNYYRESPVLRQNDVKRRWYVTRDLQGGNFGMYRLYTADEWLDQAIEWLSGDGYFDEEETVEEYCAQWEPIIAKNPQELIDYIESMWELDMVEDGKDGHNYSEEFGEDDY